MKFLFLLSTSLMLLIPHDAAYADTNSAVVSFFSNMKSMGWRLAGINQSTTIATPTAVKGLYALYTGSTSGEFLGYTNEAGTLITSALFGGTGKFSVMEPGAKKPRPLSTSEMSQLRAEAVRNIDTESLIKVTYGNGGGRKIIIWSAIDCPYCANMEASLAKSAKGLNTTLYYIIGSLAGIGTNSRGAENWQLVGDIMCSSDGGAAWKAYWQTKRVGNPQLCKLNAQQAQLKVTRQLDLLEEVGIKQHGFPAMMNEVGVISTPKATFDSAYIASTFNEAGLPAGVPFQYTWLNAR